jgi:phytoene synthase
MMTAGPELDADRRLALTYVPAKHRAAIGALWGLDSALGAVLAGGREPLISRIKLAWWRDALEALDRSPPPAEPMLQALAEHVIPSGVTGSQLSQMEEGWTLLLSQDPLTPADLGRYAAARGGLLFRYSGAVLGRQSNGEMEQAGEGWALADLARHSNATDAAAALEGAKERLSDPPRCPSPLRPLGMLAALARRDAERGLKALEPHGAPKRMLLMLRHRITGG